MSEAERCIILGSGRCGSTLLSDLIANEPDTLSVQESLTPFLEQSPTSEIMEASAYWNLLTTPSRQWEVAVRIGALTPEVRYPSVGRWAGNLAALPPIAAITLPAVSDTPDSLFDFLDRRVPRFPAQTAARHHLMLLDLLASTLRRRRWVERTGGSSALASWLLREFGADKVVYLTRNVTETVSSMSRDRAFQFVAIKFRLSIQCGVNPYDRSLAFEAAGSDRQIPEEMRCLLPERLSLQALADWGGNLEQHKLIYTLWMYEAERALRECPPRQLLRLRYEDLVAAPAEQLTRLGDFLGFADPAGWAARAAGRVSRSRLAASSAQGAPREDQAAGGHGG
jgi:putative sulfotransferase